MLIRSIEQKDIRSVLNIYNWYIENTTVTFETKRLNFAEFRSRILEITANYPWIVLEENQTVLGYAYLSSFNPRDGYQWTADLSIYLDPQVQKKGYGTLLYNEIEHLAIQQGFFNLVSIVTEDNFTSKQFHLKHGFIESGTLSHIGYKQKWLGVSFFCKQLQPLPANPVPRKTSE